MGRFDSRKIDTSVGGLVELHVLGVGLVWLVYASIITLVATFPCHRGRGVDLVFGVQTV